MNDMTKSNENDPHMREFFYTVKPITKEVTKQEFIDFINHYPRRLVRNVFGASEPPLVSYNDFELSNRWPHSIVAETLLYHNNPDEYYYKPEDERWYSIMVNYEEVFASKTGRMADE